MDRLPYRESKLVVKRCRSIVLFHMQDRYITPVDDVSHERFNQVAPIASSPVIGVSTDGTYLRISDGAQALSGHCDKPAVHSDTEILAQFVCSTAKRTRPREFDQGEHVGHIGAAERDHMSCCDWTAKR